MIVVTLDKNDNYHQLNELGGKDDDFEKHPNSDLWTDQKKAEEDYKAWAKQVVHLGTAKTKPIFKREQVGSKRGPPKSRIPPPATKKSSSHIPQEHKTIAEAVKARRAAMNKAKK